MVRDCSKCKPAKGDECILYTGISYPDCGLVPNTWYKINDLIANLQCAVNGGTPVTTTTTSTSTTTTTTSSTTTTTTTVAYNTQLTFVSDTYAFAEGVSGQALAVNPTLKLEFNKVTSPVGLYNTMIISVASSPVLQVTYRTEYTGHTFRFTNTTGIKYNGVFGSDVNF
jgi:hypothetical protein